MRFSLLLLSLGAPLLPLLPFAHADTPTQSNEKDLSILGRWEASELNLQAEFFVDGHCLLREGADGKAEQADYSVDTTVTPAVITWSSPGRDDTRVSLLEITADGEMRITKPAATLPDSFETGSPMVFRKTAEVDAVAALALIAETQTRFAGTWQGSSSGQTVVFHFQSDGTFTATGEKTGEKPSAEILSGTYRIRPGATPPYLELQAEDEIKYALYEFSEDGALTLSELRTRLPESFAEAQPTFTFTKLSSNPADTTPPAPGKSAPNPENQPLAGCWKGETEGATLILELHPDDTFTLTVPGKSKTSGTVETDETQSPAHIDLITEINRSKALFRWNDDGTLTLTEPAIHRAPNFDRPVKTVTFSRQEVAENGKPVASENLKQALLGGWTGETDGNAVRFEFHDNDRMSMKIGSITMDLAYEVNGVASPAMLDMWMTDPGKAYRFHTVLDFTPEGGLRIAPPKTEVRDRPTTVDTPGTFTLTKEAP